MRLGPLHSKSAVLCVCVVEPTRVRPHTLLLKVGLPKHCSTSGLKQFTLKTTRSAIHWPNAHYYENVSKRLYLPLSLLLLFWNLGVSDAWKIPLPRKSPPPHPVILDFRQRSRNPSASKLLRNFLRQRKKHSSKIPRNPEDNLRTLPGQSENHPGTLP